MWSERCSIREDINKNEKVSLRLACSRREVSVDLAAFLYPRSIKVAVFQDCGTSNVVVLQIPVVKYLATPLQMALLVLLRGSNVLKTSSEVNKKRKNDAKCRKVFSEKR